MAQDRPLGNAARAGCEPSRDVLFPDQNRVITRLTDLRGLRRAVKMLDGNIWNPDMLRKLSRLFVIKTRLEAFMIIYALALGAVERGTVYLARFPGVGGKLLFLACTGAVFMAGAKILDCVRYEKAERDTAGPTA